jgi:hypothetical protein
VERAVLDVWLGRPRSFYTHGRPLGAAVHSPAAERLRQQYEYTLHGAAAHP